MDADGTRAGYDLRAAASGPGRRDGAGDRVRGGRASSSDFAPAVAAGADAVLAASVFHFGELRIGDGQGRRSPAAGYPVR